MWWFIRVNHVLYLKKVRCRGILNITYLNDFLLLIFICGTQVYMLFLLLGLNLLTTSNKKAKTTLLTPLQILIMRSPNLSKVALWPGPGVCCIKWDVLKRPHGRDEFGEKDISCNKYCYTKCPFLRPWGRCKTSYFLQRTPGQRTSCASSRPCGYSRDLKLGRKGLFVMGRI